MVYIREAHPSDFWQVGSNEREGIVYASPSTDDERCDIAQTCVAALEVGFPAVVDGVDDATDEAYSAWPERLYLVGSDGRILYKSRPGPFGFDPEELRLELERLIAP
jgi:type I thyroxine 5'-deiodinase